MSGGQPFEQLAPASTHRGLPGQASFCGSWASPSSDPDPDPDPETAFDVSTPFQMTTDRAGVQFLQEQDVTNLGIDCVYQGPSLASRENRVYDDRFSAIENTLKLLLDLKGAQLGTTPTATVLPPNLSGDHRHTPATIGKDQKVTSIASDDQRHQDLVDDSLDGITVIPNTLDTKATFFGS
ncbi:hypothetical protein IFR05_008881 [Cadophora sp. M221]|nr:hypothetical protein IFR05_008881 [Cadophora sp. M221]